MSIVLSELIDDTTAPLRSERKRKVPWHPPTLVSRNHSACTVSCPNEQIMSFVFQLGSRDRSTKEQQGEQEFHRVPLLIDSSSLVIAIFISSSVLFVSFKTPVSA